MNGLRMRPDRIVVGEVRGEEVYDMLQAASAGTISFLSTVCADSAPDALSRIETMISMANPTCSSKDILRQIASTIHVFVHISRLPDGRRKVLTISEMRGIEDDVTSLQNLFVFVPDGRDEQGSDCGIFRATGLRSRFANRLAHGERRGLRLTLRPIMFTAEHATPAFSGPVAVYHAIDESGEVVAVLENRIASRLMDSGRAPLWQFKLAKNNKASELEFPSAEAALEAIAAELTS
jgi:Type II/IV secretion system protein